VVLEDLRLAAVDQNERPPRVADVQGFVVLIENEYWGVYHAIHA
jgi:hypothetical protein